MAGLLVALLPLLLLLLAAAAALGLLYRRQASVPDADAAAEQVRHTHALEL